MRSFFLQLTTGSLGLLMVSSMAWANPVVASRGTATVTLQEVDAKVMELPPDIRASYLDSPRRIEDMVSNMLLEKQMANRARELGIESDPLLETQLQLAQERYLAGRAKSRIEQNLKDNMPDFSQLAREVYLANPSKYSIPESVNLNHILVSIRGRSEAEARERAAEARQALIDGSRPVEDLAAEFSDERQGGAPGDGKLENVKRGMMVPEFEAAVFKLREPGEVTDIIETRFGFHVAQLVSRVEPETLPFEQVEESIATKLEREHLEKAQRNEVDSLRSLAIEADPETVASLRTRYQQADEGILPPLPIAKTPSTDQ